MQWNVPLVEREGNHGVLPHLIYCYNLSVDTILRACKRALLNYNEHQGADRIDNILAVTNGAIGANHQLSARKRDCTKVLTYS